jgi:hypothetical protein
MTHKLSRLKLIPDLDPNIIREEERKNLGSLSELIAIKQYSRQFFDVVIFREEESRYFFWNVV